MIEPKTPSWTWRFGKTYLMVSKHPIIGWCWGASKGECGVGNHPTPWSALRALRAFHRDNDVQVEP